MRKKSKLSLHKPKRRKRNVPVKQEVPQSNEDGGLEEVDGASDQNPSTVKVEPVAKKMKKGLNVQKMIQDLVRDLHEGGYEAMLIVVKVSESSVIQHGSKKGAGFLNTNKHIPREFFRHCAGLNPKKLKPGVDQTVDKQKPQSQQQPKKIIPTGKPSVSQKPSHLANSNLDVQCISDDENDNIGDDIYMDNDMDEDDNSFDDKTEEVGKSTENDHTKIKAKVVQPKIVGNVINKRLYNKLSKVTKFAESKSTVIDFLKTEPNLTAIKCEKANTSEPSNTKIKPIEDAIKIDDLEFSDIAKDVLEKLENIEELKTELKEEVDSGMFRCVFCETEGTTKQLTIHHIDGHVKQMSQALEICDVCNIELPKNFVPFHRLIHSEGHHSLPPEVVKAERDIRNDIAMFLSKVMHEKSDTYPCRYCEMEFTTVEVLVRHFITQHTSKYICMLCSTEIHGYYKINKHIKLHQQGSNNGAVDNNDGKTNNLLCPHCFKTFQNKQVLRRHLNAEHVDQKHQVFPCSKCGKTYISESALQNHSIVHEKRTCNWDDCNETFDTIQQYNKHVKGHNIQKRAGFLCNECGMEYSSNHRLDLHIRITHMGEKPFQCEVCASSFTSREGKKRHMAIHSDECKYICETCGQGFKMAASLWKHKFQHTDEKFYKCAMCNRGFGRKESLEIHLVNNKHFTEAQPESKIKYVKCKHCFKVLVNRMQLKRHTENTHEAPKPCPYCDKKFNDKSNLRIHMQSHTQTKPTCQICQVVFRSQVKLSEHMTNTHQILPADVGLETSSPIKPYLATHVPLGHQQSMVSTAGSSQSLSQATPTSTVSRYQDTAETNIATANISDQRKQLNSKDGPSIAHDLSTRNFPRDKDVTIGQLVPMVPPNMDNNLINAMVHHQEAQNNMALQFMYNKDVYY